MATLHRLPSLRSFASTPHRGLVEVATIFGLFGYALLVGVTVAALAKGRVARAIGWSYPL